VTYGGCGVTESTTPSHLCHRGDELGAFFKSDLASVVYSVCVKFPTGKSICAASQEAAAETLYVNKITSNIVGPTTITWSVGSQPVGSWTFSLYPDPVVPKFCINPLIVSGKHQLVGLLVKNVRRGSRVRAWRECEGRCPLRLRSGGADQGTRRYVITGPQARRSFNLGDVIYVEVDAPGQRRYGSRVWGRVYIGKLVHQRRGRSTDTAVRRVGPLLCTPPGAGYQHATSCDRVS
jgi:hypothetical protein